MRGEEGLDGRPRVAWVLAGDSYQATSDPRLRFALPGGGRAETAEIRWPSGRRQRLLEPPVERYLVLFEPE